MIDIEDESEETILEATDWAIVFSEQAGLSLVIPTDKFDENIPNDVLAFLGAAFHLAEDQEFCDDCAAWMRTWVSTPTTQ